MKNISTPLDDQVVRDLPVGTECLISGIIYTARDAAHKRMYDALMRGEKLPFESDGAVLYYAGPTPPPPGRPIGSVGPTTSYRMDAYAPLLMEKAGIKGMIGKGERNKIVIDAMKTNNTVYFAAIGGCGALTASSVISSEIIAYEDLGAEALRRLVVKDFYAIVVTDCNGNDLYKNGPDEYRKTLFD